MFFFAQINTTKLIGLGNIQKQKREAKRCIPVGLVPGMLAADGDAQGVTTRGQQKTKVPEAEASGDETNAMVLYFAVVQ